MSVCPGEPGLLAEPGTHIKPPPADPSGKASAQLPHPRALLQFLYLSDLFKCVCVEAKGGKRVSASQSGTKERGGGKGLVFFVHLMPVQKEELAGSLGANKHEHICLAISLPLRKIKAMDFKFQELPSRSSGSKAEEKVN